LANLAVATDDDVGAEGVAGTVGSVLLLTDEVAIFACELGTRGHGRRQDGVEDGCGSHTVRNDR
jgi:hypothetical protein